MTENDTGNHITQSTGAAVADYHNPSMSNIIGTHRHSLSYTCASKTATSSFSISLYLHLSTEPNDVASAKYLIHANSVSFMSSNHKQEKLLVWKKEKKISFQGHKSYAKIRQQFSAIKLHKTSKVVEKYTR